MQRVREPATLSFKWDVFIKSLTTGHSEPHRRGGQSVRARGMHSTKETRSSKSTWLTHICRHFWRFLVSQCCFMAFLFSFLNSFLFFIILFTYVFLFFFLPYRYVMHILWLLVLCCYGTLNRWSSESLFLISALGLLSFSLPSSILMC